MNFGIRECKGFRGEGGGGRAAERTDSIKQILCSDVKLKNVFSCLGNFSTYTRFQI